MKVLHQAELNDAAYRDCLAHAVTDYEAWKASRIVFPFNPFRATGGKSWRVDYAFTEQVMRSCRKTLGVRCVLDNHDLDAPPPKTMLPIYDIMKKLGPEIEFQNLPGDAIPAPAEGAPRAGAPTLAPRLRGWYCRHDPGAARPGRHSGRGTRCRKVRLQFLGAPRRLVRRDVAIPRGDRNVPRRA